MAGLLIAAPASGSGKTTVTLGLLRALKRRGVALAPGKAGPDYIDPAFHAAACGEPCFNYDPWAMRPELILANAALQRHGGRLAIVEAMMGLFDGAADGTGSAAELAKLLRLPVVLVVDCARLSHSVAPLVRGFAGFDPGVLVAGVVLNRVAGERHEAMLRAALDKAGAEVFGVIGRDEGLSLPERHLGLVQAGEHGALDAFVERAADAVETGCDIEAILKTARRFAAVPGEANIDRLAPPGQRIAVARDVAFAFSYEHMLLGWRRRGAEIRFFSPLSDEGPGEDADAVYLPGGYPELHAGRLAAADGFRGAMAAAAARGAVVYGECGGYMALGETLTDAEGGTHRMAGLLPLKTRIDRPQRVLGYRLLRHHGPLPFARQLSGHEHHYSSEDKGEGPGLFVAVTDARGRRLPPLGLALGRVCGSFAHVIDAAPEGAAP